MEHRRHFYHARINARLTLEQIGLRTALSPTVLRNIDEGRFELLPSGVYARSYVRTFAGAVGLDPEAALAEVEHLLPGAPDPLPAMNAAKGPSPVDYLQRWVALLIAQLRSLVSAGRAQAAAAQTHLTSRLSLEAARLSHLAPWLRDRARTIDRFEPRRVLAGREHVVRYAAAAIDAALLLIVDSFLVLLISWSSGIPARTLLQDAGWALAAFSATPVLLYFLLFGGIAGTTVGRWFCRVVQPAPNHPLTLPDILRRAAFH